MMNDTQETPVPCSNGCGFFGTPKTHNLCSKCFRDHLQEQLNKDLTKLNIDGPKNVSTESSVVDSRTTPPSTSDDSTTDIDSGPTTTKKNRCQCCNKRVGLTGFGCGRCGGMFCGVHRYPEEHSCDFDFKVIGRVQLAKENPVCNGDKLLTRI